MKKYMNMTLNCRMRILRWMSSKTRKDRTRNEDIEIARLALLKDKMRGNN